MDQDDRNVTKLDEAITITIVYNIELNATTRIRSYPTIMLFTKMDSQYHGYKLKFKI